MANEQNLKPFGKGYDVRRGHKPKGSKHISTLIRTYLEDVEINYTLLGKEIAGTPVEAIIKATIIKAINGELKAAELLFKYGYGPLKEEVEQQHLIITTRMHRRYDTEYEKKN